MMKKNSCTCDNEIQPYLQFGIPYLPQADDLESKMVRVQLLADLIATYKVLVKAEQKISGCHSNLLTPEVERIRTFLEKEI